MDNVNFEKISLTVWAENCDDILTQLLECVYKYNQVNQIQLNLIDWDSHKLELVKKEGTNE